MKNLIILSFLLFLFKAVYTQDYLIYFAGTGGSTSVDQVKVENLTQGTELILDGNDILNLKAELTPELNEEYNHAENRLLIYPNPVTDYATVEFVASAPGDATIAVYDQVGKALFQTRVNMEEGVQTYQLAGLGSGVYIIRVSSGNFTCSGKIISLNESTEIASITRKNFTDCSENESRLKSTNSTIQMQYNSGDRLKFVGVSGSYSTVIMDMPSCTKTITFNFIACTDGDNNNYPVVRIGAQTWMAENLKTTKYNDGDDISNINDGNVWAALNTPAYCWYNNDETSNKDIYGALYNWYTVNTGELCPSGWQVPSDADWTNMLNNIGGDTIAGNKLRETGTSHWSSPNNTATNETGFTDLPTGYRGVGGAFGSFGVCNFQWSSTQSTPDRAWYRYLSNSISSVNRGDDAKAVGFSVRCIKESSGTVTDIDGNIYHTITIGTQIWMVENLKTTRYNDGTDIYYGTPEEWADLTSAAFCWYNDSMSVYKEPYGALYNWYAVNTGKLCPAGWHVPDNDDWNTLITYLGGEEVAGGKLKETGTIHWFDPNEGATNETGFTALPGGSRWDYETYNFINTSGYWWSTDPDDADYAWFQQIINNYSGIYGNSAYKHCGLSVRCIKD
jgi:uncharacterized protein (TIGR02145 family)